MLTATHNKFVEMSKNSVVRLATVVLSIISIHLVCDSCISDGITLSLKILGNMVLLFVGLMICNLFILFVKQM